MTEHELRVYIKDHPPEQPAVSFLSWLRRFRRGMKTGAGAAVPCGTCVECCACLVLPSEKHGDDPSLYDVDEDGVIKQTADGWCIYLRDGKCSIYDKRPYMCRVYDCRTMVAAQCVILDPHTKNVIETCEAAFRKFAIAYKTPEDKLAFIELKRLVDGFARDYPEQDAGALILAALMALDMNHAVLRYGG